MTLRRSKRRATTSFNPVGGSAHVPVPSDAISLSSVSMAAPANHKMPRRMKKAKPNQVQSTLPDPAPSSSYSLTKPISIKGVKQSPDAICSSTTTIKQKREDRPSPEECEYATLELGKLHPDVLKENNKRRDDISGACGKQNTLLDGVISTMLSQNTTAANTIRAFANLKKAFPTWDKVVALSSPDKLEAPIKVAGLAKTRAQRMWELCHILHKERGEATLEYLRDLSDDDVKKELSRFKGVGPKTISCVLLFTLGRSEFPVDTHVLRITKQMGWLPSGVTSRESAYEYLNSRIPSQLKLDLHCLLIAHGRQCHRCAARGKPQFPPKDGTHLACPLFPRKVLTATKTIEDATKQTHQPSIKQQ